MGSLTPLQVLARVYEYADVGEETARARKHDRMTPPDEVDRAQGQADAYRIILSTIRDAHDVYDEVRRILDA